MPQSSAPKSAVKSLERLLPHGGARAPDRSGRARSEQFLLDIPREIQTDLNWVVRASVVVVAIGIHFLAVRNHRRSACVVPEARTACASGSQFGCHPIEPTAFHPS